MKNFINKYVLLILVLLYIILLSGCKDIIHINNDNMENNISGAGYVEKNLELPRNTKNIYSIKVQQDSTVDLLNDKGLFKSQDAGSTWKKVEKIDISNFQNIYIGDINNNGDIFLFTSKSQLIYVNRNNGSSMISDVVLSESEDNENTNILTMAKFTSDGNIVGLDINNSIVFINSQNGNVINEIKSDGSYRETIDNIGSLILTQTDNGVKLYDMEGKSQESNDIINDIYKVQNSNFKISGTSRTLISPQIDGKGFFACNKKGVFHYYFGGNVSEQIINGSLYSISDAGYLMQSFSVLSDDTFLVVLKKIESGDFILKKYIYSEETNLRASKELNIYSLYENSTIRQIVAMYNSQNSDKYANYLVGIDDSNAVTVSDAIKVLNTNIIAGNGPDLIVLDGMSISSYIDKGILINIQNVIDEVNKQEKLFDGISKAYSFGDETYAIAARYMVPLLIGESDIIKNIDDINSLAKEVTKLKGVYPEMHSIIGLYNRPLLSILYNICVVNFFKSDGSLDELEIKNYFEKAKEIQDVQLENVNQENINKIEANFKDSPNPELDQMLNVGTGEQRLAITEMGTFNYFNMMPSVMDKASVSYKCIGGMKKGIFIPNTVIGISAKSNKLEAAKDFLKEILSSDLQEIDVGNGFPVNQFAFDKLIKKQLNLPEDEMTGAGSNNKDQYSESYDIKRLREEMQNLKTIVKSLRMGSEIDNIIESTIIDEGIKFFNNEVTLEKAVSNVMRKLNLYTLE